MEAYGFIHSHLDYSLFTYHKHDILLNVLLYANGLIIVSNDKEVISRFQLYLSTCFHMKDLDFLKYFSEIEIASGLEGIFFS